MVSSATTNALCEWLVAAIMSRQKMVSEWFKDSRETFKLNYNYISDFA